MDATTVDLLANTGTDSCGVCEHAERYGWWGQSGTHCRKCHRSWAAFNQGHCPTCCAHFSGPSAFDEHLLPRGCRPPGEVRTKAGEPILAQDEQGIWRWAKERPDWQESRDSTPQSAGKAQTHPTTA